MLRPPNFDAGRGGGRDEVRRSARENSLELGFSRFLLHMPAPR